MTAHDEFFRKPKPAAVLKHSLLREYCNVFTSMIGSRWAGPIWFIDGYAGPGAYDADVDSAAQPGSPLVAMQIAEEWHDRGSRDLRCAFIEADSSNVAQLRERAAPFIEKGLTAEIYEGTVQAHLPAAWAKVRDAPVLTFLDPFGIAMDRAMLLNPLLRAPRQRPSEVMLNINVEAVWRIGGNLERRDGKVLPASGQERMIQRVDHFLGGGWWRQRFFEARADEGTAAAAAVAVIDDYRRQVEAEANCRSVSVPIRRRPGHPTLFLLTLFYRDSVAAYKFVDAAARASRRWRDTYRSVELAEWQEEGPDDLFGPDFLRKVSEAQAASQEDALQSGWVEIIERNLERLVVQEGSVALRSRVLDVLGDTVALAGEKEIRKAWDALAAAGVVMPRDKTERNMYKLSVVAKRL